jgi:hypothetical protein
MFIGLEKNQHIAYKHEQKTIRFKWIYVKGHLHVRFQSPISH